MAFTLVSISQLDDAGSSITFSKGMCTIKNPNGQTIATIPWADGPYCLVNPYKSNPSGHANIAAGKISISEVHHRLGHISHTTIKHAITSGWITGINLDMDSKPDFCKPCAKAKSAHQPFPKESDTQATWFGKHIHWDLWGPASVRSLSGNLYCTACIDDHSHETSLYFQPNKSDTIKSYKWDEALIETHPGNRIKFSHSDQGGAFLSNEIKSHQDSQGTIHKLTVHDSPSQNGVSEHRMQTWAELTRALLIASGLPRFLLEEVIKHIAWLKDRSPHCAFDGKFPYKIKHKKAPHLANICKFGTVEYVKDLKARKLDPCAKLRQFMGYDSESKGFCIYWPNKQSVTVKHNVIFNQEDVPTRSDHVVIPGDVLSEGKREKLIQHPENTAKTNDKQPDNQNRPNSELQNSEIPNHLPTPFHSLHLQNLNNRHLITWKSNQLSNQIWAAVIEFIIHLATMQSYCLLHVTLPHHVLHCFTIRFSNCNYLLNSWQISLNFTPCTYLHVIFMTDT